MKQHFTLTWAHIPGRREGCLRAVHKRHVFETSVSHGGGWVALHYGPSGAVKDAKDFWQPERARLAREWCEDQAKRIRR